MFKRYSIRELLANVKKWKFQLVLWFIVAMTFYLHVFHDRIDIYPFYRWDMFTKISPTLIDYTVTIDELDGSVIDKDLYSHRSNFTGHSNRQIYFSIERLGNEWLKSQDQGFLVQESKLMSQVFFTKKAVTYSLFQREIDRLEYLKSRIPQKQELLVRRRCVKSESTFSCETID